MIGPPLSETETDSPVAVLTTWPEMNPPPMSANGGSSTFSPARHSRPVTATQTRSFASARKS